MTFADDIARFAPDGVVIVNAELSRKSPGIVWASVTVRGKSGDEVIGYDVLEGANEQQTRHLATRAFRQVLRMRGLN